LFEINERTILSFIFIYVASVVLFISWYNNSHLTLHEQLELYRMLERWTYLHTPHLPH